MDERVEPLPDAPEGTCVRMPGSGVWAVRGRTAWFRVNAQTESCECADFLAQKRRGQPLTPCGHLRRLGAYLIQKHAREREPVGLPADADLRRLFS